MTFFNIFYTLVRSTTVKVTTAVVQLSISAQQWLLRRTLRYNVFVMLIGIPYVKHTITTITYTVYINYVQTMLIHAKSY